jgi:hypothetical protein
MDGAAARRIMSSAYSNNGSVQKGSFAARAQSAAAKNMNAGTVAGWSASKNSGASKGSGGVIGSGKK